MNRLQNKKLSTDTPFLIDYQYKGSKRNTGDVTKYKTTQLASESLGATKYSYTYDDVGNITVVKKNGSAYSSYTYDELSQLTRENLAGKKTSVWEYDELGNIKSRKEYAYTTEALGTATKTITYGYGKDGKNGWNNLLVSVDENGNRTTDANEKISYDAIGNPVSYLGDTLTWFGRQLQTYKTGDTTLSFKYGADGLRRTKTVTTGSSTVTSEFVYANDLLIYEKRGNKELYFYYDGLGHLTAVRYYSSASSTSYKQYYVATNLAGDVLAFVDGDGDVVAEYEYDAWGNCRITKDSTSVDIATLNPIRYRGYYLDSETGYYYLQSRYYDPQIGRFLNIDDPVVLKESPMILTDKNLFAYCDNNPVTRTDDDGEFWETAFDLVSLSFSIVDVAKNPSDPWAWAGLVGDAVDLVPFVTGAGEIVKSIKVAKKAAEAIDTSADVVKIGKKAPVVIGENMKRVKKYAEQIGGHAYSPWKNVPFDYDTAMRRNKRWINDMMNEGREIIDIGPDFARRRNGGLPSDFYNMERSMLVGYGNYKKVFNRSGKCGGIFGEW